MSFLTKPVENFAHWAASSHKKRIYEFHEASSQDKDLLGVKGADLCELSRIGLPIPPGFVITTETCVDYFHLNKTKSEIDYFVEDKKMPDNLQRAMENAVRDIEKKTKMTFGASHNGEMPLLLAIRAGAAMPMPGMMDTVLNVGINDGCVLAITECTGNRRFALDLHRRFLQMFGTTVLKVSHQEYESRLADAMSRDGVDSDTQLSTDSLIYLIGEFKSLSPVPEDPHVQLLMVVEAIFCSWFSDRARKHRQRMEIEEEMGAAVMVQAMVYGNRNSRSGVGIAYSRNPETGEHHVFGEYLRKGEGDDIAHTAQAPAPIQDLRFTNAHALEQIAHFLALLENNYRDAQLIEFTIDDGQLYVLERKPVKKSPLATLRIAVDMVKCKLLSEREAIMKVDPLQMVYFLSPMIDPVHTYANVDVLGIGSKSSAGAVSGKAVFTTDDAKELRNMGVTNVLILDDLFPADVDDLNYADAVLVMHGGVTSPAAEMARGLIIPAVTALHGCGMAVNVRKHCVEKDGDVSINRHDDITVDGSNGRVIRGVVPTVQAGMDNNFLTIMKWAQKYKKMGVFCTAKNLDEATKALDLGADGLGMYRTETVLTKAANRDLLLGILLGATKMDREKYLELMEDELCTEIQAVFHMFEGKEVSIRLLDPSLNQILPRTGEQIAELAKKLEMTEAHVVRQVQLLTQSNPDIGLRGCRLGILYPELVEMQTRAILRAAVKVKQSGDASPRVQLLVPMVSTDHEIEDIAPVIKSAAAEFFSSADEVVSFVIGSSLDVPRACMRANAIAGEGDVAFLSINTDLLTELTYGMSRHDSSRLIDSYTRIGIMKRDPFISLDRNGVGSLLKIAKNLIRRSNRFIRVGVCGEQSGDPASIEFYDSLGMDYVSCHHFLIPTAKVAAAQAHITSAQRESVWNKALHEGQHF